MSEGINKFKDLVPKNWHLPFTNIHIDITGSIVEMWIVMAIIIVLGLIVRIYMKTVGFKKVPESPFQNFVEFLVKWIYDLVEDVMGKECRNYGALVGTIGIALLFCNLFSITGIPQPTADPNVAIGFALVTFFNVHYQAIKKNGFKGWFKMFVGPVPAIAPMMVPINAVVELAVPVSLSMRLFGNMVAGAIIMGLYYGFAKSFAFGILGFGLPIPLHGFFDLFDGAVQTFVFMMLTMVFIKNALQHGGEH